MFVERTLLATIHDVSLSLRNARHIYVVLKCLPKLNYGKKNSLKRQRVIMFYVVTLDKSLILM